MESIRSLQRFITTDPDLARLRNTIAPRLSDDPGHDYAHALRVALWTLRLGTDEVNPRDCVAAALCHDLINVPKDSPARADASSYSAMEAQRLLPSFGFEADAIAAIADAIRDHSFSRGAVPSTSLGRALQDADRLEALGAIGVMRTISTGVRMGTKFFDSDDPWAAGRDLDDRTYSIDHFFTKLLRLAETMCTTAGRAEAHRRICTMKGFLNALAEEIAIPISRPFPC